MANDVENRLFDRNGNQLPATKRAASGAACGKMPGSVVPEAGDAGKRGTALQRLSVDRKAQSLELGRNHVTSPKVHRPTVDRIVPKRTRHRRCLTSSAWDREA